MKQNQELSSNVDKLEHKHVCGNTIIYYVASRSVLWAMASLVRGRICFLILFFKLLLYFYIFMFLFFKKTIKITNNIAIFPMALMGHHKPCKYCMHNLKVPKISINHGPCRNTRIKLKSYKDETGSKYTVKNSRKKILSPQ